MQKKYFMQLFPVFVLFISVTIGASSCDKTNYNINSVLTKNNNSNNKMESNKINIKVGSKTFAVTLLDNNSTKAFKKMLPLTINMIELNSNEKYIDLSQSLPTSSSNPVMIQNGDLMLYGSRTLVLFYKSFPTSYSYTRLGQVDDSTGLASVLGSGNVIVTFEFGQ